MPQMLKDPRVPPLAALMLAAIGLLPTLRVLWRNLDAARGVEADRVARAIVGGHGFSFPGNARWLFDAWNGDPDSYFPTAWVDPVFTYILAGAHWAFGSHVYVAMHGFGLLWLAVTLFCAYHIAKRFGGPWTGTLAVTLIAANTRLGRNFFGVAIVNSGLAAAVVLLAALLMIRYIEQPSTKRLVAAGLMTGFMVLTCPSVQYFLVFLPVAVVVVHWGNWSRAAGHALALTLLAAVVLAPWAIRNYVVFDKFVLVRNGGGQIAWLSTIAAAETFMPGAAGSPLRAPGQSSSPYDAVFAIGRNQELRRLMHRYQVESQVAAGVPGFEAMNEAQRDKLYLAQTKEFIRLNPGIAARMAVAKLYIYLTKFGYVGLLTVGFAILGGLMAVRDRRSWPLSLLAISFSGVFTLIIPFYGRYRAPIEPLLTVLATIGIALLIFQFQVLCHKAGWIGKGGGPGAS